MTVIALVHGQLHDCRTTPRLRTECHHLVQGHLDDDDPRADLPRSLHYRSVLQQVEKRTRRHDPDLNRNPDPGYSSSKIKSSIRTVRPNYLRNFVFTTLDREYNAYEKDIAVLNVFFSAPVAIEYR